MIIFTDLLLGQILSTDEQELDRTVFTNGTQKQHRLCQIISSFVKKMKKKKTSHKSLAAAAAETKWRDRAEDLHQSGVQYNRSEDQDCQVSCKTCCTLLRRQIYFCFCCCCCYGFFYLRDKEPTLTCKVLYHVIYIYLYIFTQILHL